MNTIGSTSSNRYIRKIDYREPTADYKIANQVKDGSKILEIGTSSGYMSEFLKHEKNCEVTGVEFNKKLFDVAKKFFVKGYNEDLNKITEWENQIEDNYFDYIICQDVLEHLLNPFEVLQVLTKKLTKKGKILVSIPNVSHNAILMEILKDKFSYEQSGSLDYTHFKFYTAHSFKEEANKINLKIINHDITYLVPEDSSLNNSYMDYSIQEREILFDHYNGHVFQNIFTLGRVDEYKDVEEKLMQFKLPNYDEIVVELNKKSKKYYYHDNELLEIFLEENQDKIKIYPSIRLKKFSVELFIDDKKHNLTTFEFPAGVTDEPMPRYISTGTECITLKGKFKKGQKIGIRIHNSESIFNEIVHGEKYYESELVNLKSVISKYNQVSISYLDTLLLRNTLTVEDLDKLIAEKAENAENKSQIRMELLKKFYILNPFFSEILDFTKKKNIKVVIVRDETLEEKEALELFKNLKIENVDLITYNEMYKLTNKKTLHIGNDIYKDVLNIKQLEIDTYLYKEPIKRVKDKGMLKVSNMSENILRAIQINQIYNGLEFKYFEKFGMENTAPIYFYFTKWLYEQTRDLDNLMFLSRDGYIPYFVYQKILAKYKEEKNIKYIYTSRKAYQIPGLAVAGIEKALKTFTEFNLQLDEKIRLKDVLQVATISPDEVPPQLLKKYGFNTVDTLITLKNANKAKELLNHYADKIMKNLNEKLKLVIKYLKSEGVMDLKEINIVDIGWRGSVQNYLQKITEKNTNGFYVGTMPTEYKEIRKSMTGCFANKYLPLRRSEFLVDNIMMFELVFTAPFPQLIDFKEENGKVVPIFSKEVSETVNTAVETFQNSAMYIIDRFLEYDEYLKDITPDFCLYAYKTFIESKNYEDILEIKKLETNIGYGQKQRTFVETVKLEELLKDNKKVLKKANYAFWKGAMYIENVDTLKEYNEIKKKYNFMTSLGKFESSRYYRGFEAIFEKDDDEKE